MSAPGGAYAGWAVVAGLFAALQAVALTTRRWPTMADLVHALTRPRGLRLFCLAGWLWLGWHLFARSG
ncbi:MAG TPA: DUF6186 family protein [Acidimicrobiia bacterium]|jgi:hypothetical protein|nr:DUF6186 family protein [Acidimicrobiia bacterium]